MIKYLPSNKMEMFLAYWWSRPLDSFEADVNVANNNNTWTKYPEHMFKAGGSYTIGKFTFGTLMKLTNGTYMHDEVTDPTAEALYSGWTLEGDVNVKYALTKHAEIKLTVKDLIMSNFNQYYNYWQGQFPAMGLRAQDPRVYISLSYRF
jgi:outer membrane receptor protein involved in Fe transport